MITSAAVLDCLNMHHDFEAIFKPGVYPHLKIVMTTGIAFAF